MYVVDCINHNKYMKNKDCESYMHNNIRKGIIFVHCKLYNYVYNNVMLMYYKNTCC